MVTFPVYSFTNAAEVILEQFSNKAPLHYREITEIALENGLIKTSGLTPADTMYASIIEENARRQKRGVPIRFHRYGKGMLGLTAWLPKGLEARINEHNQKVSKELLAGVLELTPAEFESLVGRLLVAMGFEEVDVTQLSKDGGIDVRGTLVIGEAIRIKMAVQAKRWKNSVPSSMVQQLRGSLNTDEHGMVITTSIFGKQARDEAQRESAVPIALVDGELLTSLLMEHSIGTERKDWEIFELAPLEISPPEED